MLLVGWKLLPLVLVSAFSEAFAVILGGIIFVLKFQSNCRVSSEELLEKNVDGFHVYGIKGGDQGYFGRLWKSQRPLRIYCGKQFVIGKDAVMNYLDVLSSNATTTNRVTKIKIIINDSRNKTYINNIK